MISAARASASTFGGADLGEGVAGGRRDHPVKVVIARRHLGTQVLRAGHLRPGLQAGGDQRAVLLKRFDHPGQAALQALQRRRRPRLGSQGDERLQPALERLGDRHVEQVLLGAEVVADRSEVGAGGGDEVACRRSGETLLLQAGDRRLQQALSVTLLTLRRHCPGYFTPV